ncbi:MAG TPA: hypothetical protein VFO52_03030 [Longimicrobiales bacterium]|nr:hypothetical protein [Longimicrobiales bacterium]
MTYNLTRRRAVSLAVLISLGFGAFTFLSGRRSGQEAEALPTPAADTVPDSAAVAPPPVPQQDSAAIQQLDRKAPAPVDSTRPAVRYRAGEDPSYATRMGWPVEGPAALPGAILPNRRIIAYYGNPLSKRMGALGEFEPQDMLRRLDREVAAWRAADPATPVQPALHLIAVVAQGDAGPSGKYRTIMRDTMVEMVYGWAKSKDAIMFIDIQTGLSNIRELLPRFEHFLKRPDVHLGVDPEFMMKSGHRPGTKIGTMDASDINYVTGYLAELVRKHNLPPKVLVVHRFTRNGVTNYRQIKLRPEVQVVIHMDGWGAPWLKRDSYKDYVVSEPVQYTGFKLFYHNDTKKGDPLMKPHDLLKLEPKPLYIQYQ